MTKDEKKTNTETVSIDKNEELKQEQTITDNSLPVQDEVPEIMEIIVTGKASKNKTSLLAAIIKDCLERDFYFRTNFQGVNVQLRELVDPDFKN